MQLICTFVFAYAKSRFSHDLAQLNTIVDVSILATIMAVTGNAIFLENPPYCESIYLTKIKAEGYS